MHPKCNPNWTTKILEGGPTWDQNGTENGTIMGPTWGQDGPKWDQNWTKMIVGPKWDRNGTKMGPKCDLVLNPSLTNKFVSYHLHPHAIAVHGIYVFADGFGDGYTRQFGPPWSLPPPPPDTMTGGLRKDRAKQTAVCTCRKRARTKTRCK